MNNKKEFNRDNKGDIKFDFGEVNPKRITKSRHTYIFHYYDNNKNHYFPYFGLFSQSGDRMEKAMQEPEFFEKQLYSMPDNPPYDFFIRHHNMQLAMLIEYFKEVFEERAFIDGYLPSHKYWGVILPKSRHDEIINCINDFELLPIRDLLFEIISIAQHNYVKHIAIWENPEMQKLITTAEKESQKVIEVISKWDTTSWESDDLDLKPPSELLHINFSFNDGTVKIAHSWLANEFINHFKSYYDNLHYKNWRLELEHYPDLFEDNIKKQQFKYKMAKSLYNLLKEFGHFKVTQQEPTPNKLMHCIVKLLEFCLIQVGTPHELDETKIKNARNWITRNELKSALTYAELPANKEKLLKYFEPEFINITDNIKRADAISIGFFLGKRFNLSHLVPDLVHIAQALNEVNLLIDHQITGDESPFDPSFEEFIAFKKLINGIREGKKITSLKYTLQDNQTEYELTQRLPLYLIEEAIKEYAEDQKVEIDNDLVKTNFTKTENGSLKVEKDTQFALPEERFMVKFVKAFYDYLLSEAPPGDQDYMPSNKYYAIIAIILHQTGFFYHKMHDERFIIAKVKQWHQLAHV